jgi:hypothetical protein
LLPWRGTGTTSPSAASTLSASRSGVRLICQSRASASSSIHWPGASWRSKIMWRSREATSSCREAGRSGVGSTMDRLYNQ